MYKNYDNQLKHFVGNNNKPLQKISLKNLSSKVDKILNRNPNTRNNLNTFESNNYQFNYSARKSAKKVSNLINYPGYSGEKRVKLIKGLPNLNYNLLNSYNFIQDYRGLGMNIVNKNPQTKKNHHLHSNSYDVRLPHLLKKGLENERNKLRYPNVQIQMEYQEPSGSENYAVTEESGKKNYYENSFQGLYENKKNSSQFYPPHLRTEKKKKSRKIYEREGYEENPEIEKFLEESSKEKGTNPNPKILPQIIDSEYEKNNEKKEEDSNYYTEDFTPVLRKIFKDIIGNGYRIKSPFGHKNFLIYTDYTASGRGLKTVEKFIQEIIFPSYANVHTEIGYCADQTHNLLNESKDIIRDYCHAWEGYSVVLAGSGSTGGMQKITDVLNVKQYIDLYENLKSLKEVTGYFKDEFNQDDSFIFKKVCDLYKKIFCEKNFFMKVHRKGGSKVRCLLCEEEFDGESLFRTHEMSPSHLEKLSKYNQSAENLNMYQFLNKKRDFTDFIDIIRKEYGPKLTKENISKIVQDLERFKPIVFTTRFEHNSNRLNWIGLGVELVRVDDINDLKNQIQKYKDRYIKIGSFSAASNVTGKLFDVDEFALVIHKEGGYAFFDYAQGSPYLIMNCTEKLPDDYRKLLDFIDLRKTYGDEDVDKYCYKDGLFYSPHKFIGGAQSPGLVIFHERISKNLLSPSRPGGGTVDFVHLKEVVYLRDNEKREESGTPNIIGGIRIGLTLSVRNKYDHYLLLERDEKFNTKVRERFGKIKLKDIDVTVEENHGENIYFLDYNELRNKPHIPVYSFVISYKNSFYHCNFISSLLNDLFGIQSRPGCSCTPDYSFYSLGFTASQLRNDPKAVKITDYIHKGCMIMKPGYSRLNLPYFYPDYLIDFVIDALDFIRKYAFLFLGFYEYETVSGVFRHYNKNDFYNMKKISKDYNNETMSLIKNSFEEIDTFSPDKLKKILEEVNEYIVSDRLINELNEAEKNIVNKEDELFKEYKEHKWFIIYEDIKKEIDEYKNLKSIEERKEFLAKKNSEDNNRLKDFNFNSE